MGDIASKETTGLHFGRLLDVAGVPLCLKAPGLKAHTLIVGQSGSGKSFMLGRLLEEIVAKTKARIVIMDPNSDFVRFSEVQEDAWKRYKTAFEASDSLKNFQKSWSNIRFSLLSSRDPADLALKNALVDVTPATVSWGNTGTLEAASQLGFDPRIDVDEIFAINTILHPKEFEPFKDFVERAGELSRSTKGPRERSADRVYVRAAEMDELTIWATEAEPGSVCPAIQRLLDPESERRVLCLDLASLEKQEERLMVASLALGELWSSARKAWLNAIRGKPDEDKRLPVFVVIDEAHNLAPTMPLSGLARSVSETLARIATEGRKYGIFLLMVTQRPSRLDETLRTQCDNLCLMKMNDRHDLQLIENSFGFVPQGWASRAMDFDQGDVLLAGALIERPVFAHAAPRRTAEGGRNLRDEAWLPRGEEKQ